MAARRRKAKPAAWSYSAGARGENRVRVYERPGYGIWIDYRAEDGKRCRHPLGITDRDQAKVKADDIAAKFRRDAKRQPTELTLAALIDNYLREVTPTKSAVTQSHDRRALALFLGTFGRDRRPRTLSRRDWDAYIAGRRSGKIRPPKSKATSVRDRVIEQDLGLLNALLNWGAQAGDGRGGYLLERNPFKGLPIPAEESPRRALLTSAQYEALRAAAMTISPRLECFVVLAWHTGHRANSIRQLRWSDVDLERERIHFRGENDKIGLDHWNPLHPDAVAILKRERTRTPTIGDAWLFPAARENKKPVVAPTQPLSRDAVNNLWKRMAVKAELPEGERYGWHSCRRAFANRLRKAPLRDLQDLGGWKTAATVLSVYLRPDEEAQRQALTADTLRVTLGSSEVQSG